MTHLILRKGSTQYPKLWPKPTAFQKNEEHTHFSESRMPIRT